MITSFDVTCENILKSGDTILATVRGTPKGQVWIEISGIPLKIYLPEISQGLYQISYRLEGDLPGVYKGNISAHLAINGEECNPAIAGEKVTILGENPLFYNLTPMEGTIVKETRPVIYADIACGNSQVDEKTLKISLNGEDITHNKDTVINPKYITFAPSYNLKEGGYRVSIYGRTIEGKEFATAWNFFIKFASAIISVSHNATKPLAAGEILEVQLVGEPCQMAYFNIGEWRTHLPMNESFRTPGLYIGSYTVCKGDYVANLPVTGHLKLKNGETVISRASSTVTIISSDLVVRIDQPGNGETVAGQFLLLGLTRPYTNVRIDMQITYTIPAMGFVEGGVIGKEVISNDMGVFEYNVSIKNQLKGTKYTITAIAIDAQGNKSPPCSITVYQK